VNARKIAGEFLSSHRPALCRRDSAGVANTVKSNIPEQRAVTLTIARNDLSSAPHTRIGSAEIASTSATIPIVTLQGFDERRCNEVIAIDMRL
jgi:hypothetical protein